MTTAEITLDDLGVDPRYDVERVPIGEPPPVRRRQPRDPGSYIGNQPWKGVGGDPITGTHNGHLDAAARERRAQKNARNRANRVERSEANRRGNRG